MASTRLIQGDAYEGLRSFRNYISNSTFELGILKGWATYADAAATTPVDGTGGSPNVTFAIQSGSLIRNAFCARLTKDAANRQGQGASFDFTIDAADKSKPLLITFDFIASANYAANDIGVYIYDVTNATLITPAQVNIPAGTGSINSFFVATTSTSYRLILHVASTNASAYTLDVDNFFVGAGSLGVGYAGTDWQSYTPNVSGFTLSTSVCFWRRSGDSMEIQGFVTSTAAPSGSITVGLPSGYTIDTAKYNRPAFNDLASAGVAQLYPGTGSTSYTGSVYASSATTMVFQGPNSPGPWNASNPVAIANPIQLGFTAKFPISQWSSNVTMADRAVEEYAFNTGTWGTNNTTSFGYGPAGASITGSLTTELVQRVRFQTPIQATDRLILEFKDSNGVWLEQSSAYLAAFGNGVPVYSSVIAGGSSANTHGASVFRVSGATTDADVVFGRYVNRGYTGSVMDVVQWANGPSWRVRKVSSNGMVGYPVSSANIVGRTDGQAPAAGMVGEQRTLVFNTINANTSSWTASSNGVALPAGTWLITGRANLSGAASSTGAGLNIATNGNNDSTGFILDVTTIYDPAFGGGWPLNQITFTTSGTTLYAKAFSYGAARTAQITVYATRIA